MNLILKRVVILARHGARTPLHDFPEMLGEAVWDPEKLFEVPHGIQNVKTNILSDEEIKISSKTLDGSALTTYGHFLPGNLLYLPMGGACLIIPRWFKDWSINKNWIQGSLQFRTVPAKEISYSS